MSKKKEKKIPKLDWQSLMQMYKLFAPQYREQTSTFLIVIFGIIVSIFTGLLAPWPLKIVLDYVLLEEPFPESLAFVTSWFGTDQLTLVTVFAFSVLLVTFLDAVFSYIHAYYLAVATERIVAGIRERVYTHLQSLSLAFHNDATAGDVVYRLTTDVKEMKQLLVGIPWNTGKRLLTVITIIVIMAMLEWRLALLAVSVAPLIFWYASRFGAGVKKATRKRKKKESKVASIVSENISSMALVQAYGQQASEKSRFDQENKASAQAGVEAIRLSKIFKRITDIFVIAGTAAVVYFGSRAALDGNILPGTLVVFVSYLKKLYSPMDKTAVALITMAQLQASSDRVVELLQNESQIGEHEQSIPLPPTIQGRVEFDNVSFAYKEGNDVIKDLSFVAQPGQTVALVGHSGAGKSTLLSLLLRFYEPQQGTIWLDDLNHGRFQHSSLRQHVTILFQKAILLRKTVRENILMGDPTASDEDVIVAAKKAQAHDFIMSLPKGYDTLVEEGGENFSGGQRQRLSIARAILRNSPILILDEPSTGLDARSEALVNEALAQLTADRTTFVIAHRFQTIRNADQILVLDKGELVGAGTHDELMQHNDDYRHFYELQFGALAQSLLEATELEESISTPPSAEGESKASPSEEEQEESLMPTLLNTSMPHSATAEMHDVGLRFNSNNPDFVAYMQEHAQGLVMPATTTPTITVNVLWLEKEEYDADQHQFEGLDNLNRIGKRILSDANQLVWLETLLVKGLQLRFRLDGDNLTMDAVYCFDPGRKPPEAWPAYRIKKYFSLMKYFVYFPMAWYLEHFHGLYMLHASAVKLNGTAVVIAGVGGVGKTTTCMALLGQEEALLLSENLIFYDGKQIYACYEPIRADDGSMEMLGETNGRFRPGKILPRVKDKNVFHLGRHQLVDTAQASALFIPKFAQETAVTALNPDICVEQLLSINTQTREVNAYYQFAAVLNLLWPKQHRAKGQILELTDLVNKTDIYELAIDPRTGVEPVVEIIQKHAKKKA
ncbi:MAG: ABC transporter ATP-binding protein [Chloroflexota bacterium]